MTANTLKRTHNTQLLKIIMNKEIIQNLFRIQKSPNNEPQRGIAECNKMHYLGRVPV